MKGTRNFYGSDTGNIFDTGNITDSPYSVPCQQGRTQSSSLKEQSDELITAYDSFILEENKKRECGGGVGVKSKSIGRQK